MKLTRRKKEKARDLARRSWIKAKGDAEQAFVLAKQEMNSVFAFIVLSILAKIIAELVWELIDNWRKNGVKEPPQVYSPQEPGYEPPTNVEEEDDE